MAHNSKQQRRQDMGARIAFVYVGLFLAAGYVAGTRAVGIVQGILSTLPIGG